MTFTPRERDGKHIANALVKERPDNCAAFSVRTTRRDWVGYGATLQYSTRLGGFP